MLEVIPLFNILVTVWLNGQAPKMELLRTEYPYTDGGEKCEVAAKSLLARAIVKKGVRVSVACVTAKTRGA